ncbi:hypothetical protein PIB30_006194 [Stylosanthes scabra]|uniref:Protein FAR1-RELATED SEQUENCE n=1 Tax=Stylosanthes scabra TaxID=79078 RepID=A0ABU6Y5X8_9FABA|nr:hypothetical protein [Stylosanthes scabra]
MPIPSHHSWSVRRLPWRTIFATSHFRRAVLLPFCSAGQPLSWLLHANIVVCVGASIMGVVESIGEFGSQNVNAGEEVKDDDAEPMGGGARERESGDSEVMEGMMPEEVLKRVFTNDEEAYEVYKEFGKYHGFGVRKGDCKRDEFGNVTSRRFF